MPQSNSDKRLRRRDIALLSGWLFADLLLGMMVLFLASTPGVAKIVPPTPTPIHLKILSPNPKQYTISTNADNLFSTDNATKMQEEENVRAEIQQRLPNIKNQSAAIVLAFGNAPSNSSSDIALGNNLANTVGELLKEAMPGTFSGAVVRAFHDIDSTQPQGNVSLEVYLYVNAG